jgi:hypothetical protein
MNERKALIPCVFVILLGMAALAVSAILGVYPFDG